MTGLPFWVDGVGTMHRLCSTIPNMMTGHRRFVVLGGDKQGQGLTNSVLLMNLAEENKHWREGPPLNSNRASHASVVCNGGVYVIGGFDGSYLNSIERIDVETLSSGSLTSATSNQWTTLTCRMSTRRSGCSAVTVYNRYIVVVGGFNGNYTSSAEIIDSAVPSNHAVFAGPSMTVPRSSCASAFIGHRIFVAGGYKGKIGSLQSVEYLEIHDPSGNETMTTTSAVFPSSCRWTRHDKLELSMSRCYRAVVSVGLCLIVARGSFAADTVNVLDTRRNTSWTFPQLSGPRYLSSAVVHSRGIAVISGDDNASCATLSLVDKNTWCFRRLIEQVPSTIFGSSTGSPGYALVWQN